MEIAPGVYSIGQRKAGWVHAFLVDDGHELTVIDTLYDTDGHRILEQIRSIGRTISDLKRIVLTHSHRSHLGGMAALKRMSGATIYSHEWEADIIEGDREAQRVPLRPIKPLPAYYIQLACALGIGTHAACPVDQILKDGDQVGPLQVVHAPGHTPGHLALYWPERRALFAGDAIVTWPELAGGWPSFTLNRKQQRGSLRRMVELNPEVVGVGHGKSITRGTHEKLHRLLEESEQAAAKK